MPRGKAIAVIALVVVGGTILNRKTGNKIPFGG